MLDRLPMELLQDILHSLDNSGLCRVASLCRSLHIIALEELLTRNRALIPTSSYCPPPRVFPCLETSAIQPSDGACISLTSGENMDVLTGLRIAQPCIFVGRPIRVIKCTFNGHFNVAMEELRHLTRFLHSNHNAVSVEIIEVDFGDCPAWVAPHVELGCGVTLLGFLQLVVGSERKLAHCVSLAFLGGHAFNYTPDRLIRTPWLRRGSRLANIVQTLGTLTSQGPLKSNADAYALPCAPRVVDLDPPSILLYLVTLGSRNAIRHYSHSIRILSLSRMKSSWISTLDHLTLPNLEEFSLSSTKFDVKILIAFLVRHRKIRHLLLQGHVPSYTPLRPLPPLFLPNVKTLICPPRLLLALLREDFGSRPLPSLKSVTCPTYVYGRTPSFYFGIDEIPKRLNDPSLGLRMALIVMNPYTGWLRDAYRPSETIYNKATQVELHIRKDLGFLENEEVCLQLPRFFQLFSAAEKVEILGCLAMNDANGSSRNKLARDILERNPHIKIIRVDGVGM